LGCFDGLFSRKASREGSAFARAFETRGTSATPAKRISLLVSHGYDRIVERRENVYLSRGNGALCFSSGACATR